MKGNNVNSTGMSRGANDHFHPSEKLYVRQDLMDLGAGKIPFIKPCLNHISLVSLASPRVMQHEPLSVISVLQYFQHR